MATVLPASIVTAINAAIALAENDSTPLGANVVTASIAEQVLTLTSSGDKTLTNGVFTDVDGSATATPVETVQSGDTQATIAFTFTGDITEIITKNDTIAFEYDSKEYTATIGDIEEEDEPDPDPDDPNTASVQFQCNYASRKSKLFSRGDVVTLKEGMANNLAAHNIVIIATEDEDKED